MSSDKGKAIKLWDELSGKFRGSPRIDQSKPYWASEWSWSPLFDGFSPCKHEKYPYYQEKDGLLFYATNKSHRVYAQWDLFEEKGKCQKLCSRKDQCGYDWDALYHNMLKKYGIEVDPGEAEKMGWIRFKPKVLSLRILDTIYPFVYGGTILAQLQANPEKSAVFANWENDDDWMIKIGMLDNILPIFSPEKEFKEMMKDGSVKKVLENSGRITLTI